MLDQVIKLLDPKPHQVYLDLTAGYGGHAGGIAKGIGPKGRLVLVDRDRSAIAALKRLWPQARIMHDDFARAAKKLQREGFEADMIMMDLGLSLPMLEDAKRGFSFLREGPLDMRMDQSQLLTAARIVNSYSEQQLADLIYQLGEERASRKIAKAIVAKRPFTTTTELVAVIAKAVGGRGRIHPATRTFQALRIAVNQELEQLQTVLPKLPSLLKPGGRLAIISFHSLEDRLVKRWLKASQQLAILTKRPLAGKTYDASNPRARSAKLRAAVKNKN